MHNLYGISGKEVVRSLERLGFLKVRQKGSHLIMVKMTKEGKVGCVVPMHKEIAVGTLKSILKQAKISAEEFLNNI